MINKLHMLYIFYMSKFLSLIIASYRLWSELLRSGDYNSLNIFTEFRKKKRNSLKTLEAKLSQIQKLKKLNEIF